jgi:hypothetical protein
MSFDAVLTKKESIDYVVSNLSSCQTLIPNYIPLHKQFNNNSIEFAAKKI